MTLKSMMARALGKPDACSCIGRHAAGCMHQHRQSPSQRLPALGADLARVLTVQGIDLRQNVLQAGAAALRSGGTPPPPGAACGATPGQGAWVAAYTG